MAIIQEQMSKNNLIGKRKIRFYTAEELKAKYPNVRFLNIMCLDAPSKGECALIKYFDLKAKYLGQVMECDIHKIHWKEDALIEGTHYDFKVIDEGDWYVADLPDEPYNSREVQSMFFEYIDNLMETE